MNRKHEEALLESIKHTAAKTSWKLCTIVAEVNSRERERTGVLQRPTKDSKRKPISYTATYYYNPSLSRIVILTGTNKIYRTLHSNPMHYMKFVYFSVMLPIIWFQRRYFYYYVYKTKKIDKRTNMTQRE